MPHIEIHHDKVADPEALVALCPFKSIEIADGHLSINAGCRMCRICIKKGNGVFEYVEDDLPPSVDKNLWRGIAVVAEIEEGTIDPVTFELIGKARELAAKVKYPVYCLMIGSEISDKAQQVLEYGVDEVFVYDQPELKYFRIEPYTAVLEDFIRTVQPSSVLVGGSFAGAPRGGPLPHRAHRRLHPARHLLLHRSGSDPSRIRRKHHGAYQYAASSSAVRHRPLQDLFHSAERGAEGEDPPLLGPGGKTPLRHRNPQNDGKEAGEGNRRGGSARGGRTRN